MQNYSVVSKIQAITAAEKAAAAVIEKRRAAFEKAKKEAAEKAAFRRAAGNIFFGVLAFCMVSIFLFSLWAVCCYNWQHYTTGQKMIMFPTFYITAVLSPVLAGLLITNIKD